MAGLSAMRAVDVRHHQLRLLLVVSPPWSTLISAGSLSYSVGEVGFNIIVDGETYRFASKLL